MVHKCKKLDKKLIYVLEPIFVVETRDNIL